MAKIPQANKKGKKNLLHFFNIYQQILNNMLIFKKICNSIFEQQEVGVMVVVGRGGREVARRVYTKGEKINISP
jgi:hypothetical protein